MVNQNDDKTEPDDSAAQIERWANEVMRQSREASRLFDSIDATSRLSDELPLRIDTTGADARRRALDRADAIETARLAELARLRARDEYEASKAAGAGQVAPVATPTAPAQTPAPVAETVQQRNARWLVRVDAEQAGTNPPSAAAIYRKIHDAEDIGTETIKKGVRKARKAQTERYRNGNIRPLPSGGKKGKKTALETFWGKPAG